MIDKEKSLAHRFPELVKEWHPTKNGDLTPADVTFGSGRKVWWKCSKGHEWEVSISNRTKGNGCPYCSGKKIWPGFNDLETCSNMVAEEWHHKKNKKKRPNQIYMYERKIKRWWICSKCKHEWRTTVHARTVGNVTCPNCRRNKSYYG